MISIGGETTPLIEKAKNEKDATGFGHKTIGFVGGLSLLMNNITGPAMVTIPLVYQASGWFTPTLCLVVMTLLSSLASGFLCEAMACIPGNEHFQGRVEFSNLVNFFFGPTWLVISQIFINAALQCANVAAIIECAQVADATLIALFHKTCGLQVHPHFDWVCVTKESSTDSPFADGTYYLFTIGFLIMMALVIPMGYLNLDDNIIVQIVADFFLVVITIDFTTTFVIHGLKQPVPAFRRNQRPVLGQLMANYGFVTTVPSWCSEKKPDVSVNKSIWIATVAATITFFVLGFFGALSFNFPKDGDILSVINDSKQANDLSKALVYLFPIMVLATTIPVFSIIVRYNLLQSKAFHKGVANFIAVILPWLVVIPFLTGNGLNQIINWGTLIFASVANFIIPFLVYFRAASFRDNVNKPLTERQREILKELSLMGNPEMTVNDHKTNLKPYSALPASMSRYSKYIAVGCAGLLGVLVVMGIIINIITLL